MANSPHLTLQTLALLLTSVLVQLRGCCCHQLLRRFSFLQLLDLHRHAHCFRLCLLGCAALCIFSYSGSKVGLLFRAQSEECRVGVEIDYLPFLIRDGSGLHIAFE